MLLIALMASPMGYTEALSPVPNSSSETQFASRLEKKQEFLMCMSQSISELKDACRKRAAMNAEDEALSSSKYVQRLEKKLGALVKESIQDIGCYRQMPAQAAFVHNLSPESKFDNGKLADKKDQTSSN